MSYNIDSSAYLSGGPLVIGGADIIALRKGQLAEGNFLTEGVLPENPDPATDYEITAPWWYGNWSGRTLDAFIAALEVTSGEADILLTWEGGDSFTGLRVRNGVVTRHKVVQVLGDEEDE